MITVRRLLESVDCSWNDRISFFSQSAVDSRILVVDIDDMDMGFPEKLLSEIEECAPSVLDIGVDHIVADGTELQIGLNM